MNTTDLKHSAGQRDEARGQERRPLGEEEPADPGRGLRRGATERRGGRREAQSEGRFREGGGKQ